VKKKKTLNRVKHRKTKADEDFAAQLEDAWHLIEKRKRLGRKELMIKAPAEEESDKKNEP
jgi:hypothetical protein